METNVPGLYIAGTAVAGTQSSHYKLFLENCHTHVTKIATHLRQILASSASQITESEQAWSDSSTASATHSSLAKEIESMPES